MKKDFNIKFAKLGDKNILARGEFKDEGVVTIMTAPPSSIDGEDGPVLIAGADSFDVTVVYSDVYIDSLVRDRITATDMTESMRAVSNIVTQGMFVGREFLRNLDRGHPAGSGLL